MKKRLTISAMALVGLVAFAVAADLLPYSHRGTDLGESGTAFGTAYVGAIVVEATGGTNTITTSAGLVDEAKLSGAKATAAVTATTRVITSADYGKTLLINTNAAVAITLPANGAAAGSWVEVAVHSAATDDCVPTISAATADTLITPNSVDSDSVTWGTGHRIGAYARFWSDGAFWRVSNLGGTTMTYTDSD